MKQFDKRPPDPVEIAEKRRHLSVVIEGRTYRLAKINDRGFSLDGVPADAHLGQTYQALFVLCDHPEDCGLDCQGRLIHDNRKCVRFNATLMAIARSGEGTVGFGFTTLTDAQQELIRTIIGCEHTRDNQVFA